MQGAAFRCPDCYERVSLTVIAHDGIDVYFFAECGTCKQTLRYQLDCIINLLYGLTDATPKSVSVH